MMNGRKVSLIVLSLSLVAQGCTLKIFPWQHDDAKEPDSPAAANANSDATGKSPQGSVPIFTGSTQAQATFGNEAKLKEGESISWGGNDGVLAGTLKFTSVGEDSRCPAGVTCVWEGQATVNLSYSSAQGTNTDIVLTLRAGHDELTSKSADGLVFKLLALDPAPAAPGTPAPTSRVARVVVSKN